MLRIFTGMGREYNVSPVIQMCNKSLHTAGWGISEVCHARSTRRRWNSSLRELQRNHSCFSAAGLPALFRLFFFGLFFFFFLLFAELRLEQAVENANICLRQAANTLTITEKRLDHFIVLVHNNDRTATFVCNISVTDAHLTQNFI